MHLLLLMIDRYYFPHVLGNGKIYNLSNNLKLGVQLNGYVKPSLENSYDSILRKLRNGKMTPREGMKQIWQDNSWENIQSLPATPLPWPIEPSQKSVNFTLSFDDMLLKDQYYSITSKMWELVDRWVVDIVERGSSSCWVIGETQKKAALFLRRSSLWQLTMRLVQEGYRCLFYVGGRIPCGGHIPQSTKPIWCPSR